MTIQLPAKRPVSITVAPMSNVQGPTVVRNGIALTQGADTVKFQGAFAGPPSPVTVKLPQRLHAQLNELAETLKLPAEEIATAAAYLVTHANDINNWQDSRMVGMVKPEALKEVFKEHEPSSFGDGPNANLYYSSFDIPLGSWKSWAQKNIQKLSLSRGLTTRFTDTFWESKDKFTFKYQDTEKSGAAKFYTALGLLIPGAQPLLLFSLPALLFNMGKPKMDLCNGINLLYNAVKAKQQDPSLALASVSVNRDTGEEKPYISLIIENKLFRNLNSAS